MRIVQQHEATKPPGMCLASRDGVGPFIDTGSYANYVNPYIYLSVAWVKEQAKELGMIEHSEIEELERKIAEQDERIEKLKAVLEAKETYEDALQQLPPIPVNPVTERPASYRGFVNELEEAAV